ncbi:MULTISPECIES: aminotransferase class V-fold PLP-dependent enzyme [Microbacterium]|uniref:Cysteine desulfurase n=2 Tax=Microbacterium TaxID=33882 RepID=A0ABX5SX09_9MICO|nr:SufS family cysteine desulfurase [Microbacterium sp. EYE_512]QBR89766.1 SufS family cysteine desulfurase [Microbacterium wangchenii]TFV85375.1 SufS family cysteine desulfurase [Microbacterium sp. dk485]TXK16636.1 SufS family cysteine desulfurase [Microbacterium wangchenii]
MTMPRSTAMRQARADFPFVQRRPGQVYLDSAATSQPPAVVLDAQRTFTETAYAAVHRGSSAATGSATTAFESARARIARFVGAGDDEIVWTENATDAINLLAWSLTDAAHEGGEGAWVLHPGDEIVITEAEHHANLVPWQRLAARTGAILRAVPVDDDGLWTLDAMAGVVSERTRLIAFAHVSNVTGFVAPVEDVVALAARHGALTFLDACQSAPHRPLDLHGLGVDFAAFSAHKMLGPTGIGVLYGRTELLNALPPGRTGGSAITTVTLESAGFLPAPHRFEPGTQPVVQAVGFAAAADYLDDLGLTAVAEREHELAQALVDTVVRVPGVRILGPAPGAERAALVSFVVDGVHPHDVGQFLDDRGVTVRTGHHCAQPLHRRLGVPATTRASAYVYTTDDDIAALGEALAEVRGFFGADR